MSSLIVVLEGGLNCHWVFIWVFIGLSAELCSEYVLVFDQDFLLRNSENLK